MLLVLWNCRTANMIGTIGKLGTVSKIAIARGSRARVPIYVYSPRELFAANEPGAWYDPSDLTTMFQDSAGTTPVTATGQTVGLLLDKSKGLVLGPEQLSVGFAVTQAGAPAAAYNTVTGQGSVSRVSSSVRSYVHFNLTSTSFYRLTIQNTGGGSLDVSALVGGGSVASGQTVTLFTSGGSSPTIFANTDGTTVTFTVVSIKELPGNHARQATAASKPLLQQDATGRYYLLFDGTDDFLVTNTITPGADKVQVFAGIRKLSDAAVGMVTELSLSESTNNGSFNLYTFTTPSAVFTSKGTAGVGAVSAVSLAPLTSIFTGLGDISGDSAILRINGIQAASNTVNQGTGNYLAYPLYIGRRGGTTFPFNGRIYQMLVRFGANLSADQISQTETWVNSKTGAY